MSKKAKLVSSLVVTLLIAIMIPVAIFATTNRQIGLKNKVQFFVEDLVGTFLYAITGNRLDENQPTSSLDVGYDPPSGRITPQVVFTASCVDDDHYVVKNGTDGIVETNYVEMEQGRNIEFDQSRRVIDYYFVFINTAPPDPEGFRTVYVTAKADHEIDPNIVTTGWSYRVATIPVSGTNSWSYRFSNENIGDPSATWNHTQANLESGVAVPSQSDMEYSYIVVKYTLELIKVNKEFSNSLNLTISLKSALA